MQTLQNSELHAVVGGCCGDMWTAPDERVITLPIQPGVELRSSGDAMPVSLAFSE